MTALVVFDLDGTLVDSSQDLADSTNEVLESYGAPPLPAREVIALVGQGARALVTRALAAAGADANPDEALERFVDVYNRRLLVTTRPYPGIVEVVRQAAATAALAVLTNKPAGPTRRLLETFDLASSFTWVMGGDSGVPRKPDPAGLLQLAASAATSPAATLMVGDSMIDVETARRAGTAMCVARYGFGAARGDLVLRGDELVAETTAAVGSAIEGFRRRLTA